MGEVERGQAMVPLKGGGDAENSIPEGKKTKQYLVAIAACLGAFTAGTILSWSSPALPMLKANNGTDKAVLDTPLTNDEAGWVGSLVAIGALLGAFPTGILCDRIGRKWTILSLGIPFILSWLLITAANGPGILYAGRIFAGIGTGGSCVAIPMYVGEIAEGSVRGALGSFFQLLLTVGILYSYVVGATVNYLWLGILSCAASIIFVIVFFFMPESPTYLLKVGKQKEAEACLKTLRGDDYYTKPEISMIQEELSKAEQEKASFTDLFKSKANVNALIVGLALMLFQQLSGVNAVIFYTEDIFKAAGSSISSELCPIIIGVVQVIATYIATVLVDRAGRKMLLLISGSVMCVCLIVLGIYFHLKEQDPESVANIGWLPLLSVALFVITFSLGFGPLPWMMMGELFSSSIKSIAASLAVMLNWSLTFLVTKTFGDLVAAIGIASTFWIFSGITGLGIIFVFFRVPETRGKTLAEIQEALGGR